MRKTIEGKYEKRLFWVDRLSFSSCFLILKLRKHNECEVVYTEASNVVLWILRSIFPKKIKIRQNDYTLGDMFSANGESLRYQVLSLSSEMMEKVVKSIKKSNIFQQLLAILPSKRLDLFFKKEIKEELFSLIRTLCIIKYLRKNGDSRKHIIVWEEYGYAALLKEIWLDNIAELYTYKKAITRLFLKSLFKALLLYLTNCAYKVLALDKKRGSLHPKDATVAVHYLEGVDVKRRSEIFWHQYSNIDPGKVLLYFDFASRFFSEKTALDHIGEMGMRWVSLSRRAFPNIKVPSWHPKAELGRFAAETNILDILRKAKTNSLLEKWIYRIAINLVYEVSYWMAFFKKFNIKIQIELYSGGTQDIAQAISLDLLDGAMFGWQRSEYYGSQGVVRGFFPHHIFFLWNKRGLASLAENKSPSERSIVSGYSYDYIFAKASNTSYLLKKQLLARGVKFIVVLYDNIFHSSSFCSPGKVVMFYQRFLHWMSQDKEVGLIVKPKKLWYTEKETPEIAQLLKQAEQTRRCVVVENSFGRFPSDVSNGIDMVVGLGISSALIEAVLAGAKGVMCDISHHYSYPFYKDGYNKIVFDEIEQFIEALKAYKEDPSAQTQLGDWSQYIDKLDPYRDGKAGQRIGSYIRWLLEGFNKGNSRNEAIQHAEKLYKDKWG